MNNSSEALTLEDTTVTQDEVRKRIAAIILIVMKEVTAVDHSLNGNFLNVTYYKGEKTTIYKLDMLPEHRGRIIGSAGKNILSLRTLVQAMAASHGFRAVIDLVV
ncbi:KH domain-containing protein [Bdellovibrio sp. HCB-162]|uniref:KH domain-containing protein n=1 Tax=Bdellovibrio sp. HCB-162 TaxID=3394234 RepID=UPI0039BC5DE3